MTKKYILIYFIIFHISILLSAQSLELNEILSINSNTTTPETALDIRDRFGVSVKVIGDLDNDGMDEIAVGANEDDDGFSNSGAIYIFFMNPDKTIKKTQKISNLYGGLGNVLNTNDNFGYSLAPLGDIDKDGINDIGVGAVYDGEFGYQKGALWILFLSSDGTVKKSSKINDTGGILGLHTQSSLGSSLTALHDIDNDGIKEIAVGAYRHSTNTTLKGSVFVIFINSDGTLKKHQLINDSTPNFNFTLDYEDYFAGRMDSEDLNNDGIIDLIVTAHRDDDNGTDTGAFYILYLTKTGNIQSTKKITSASIGVVNTSNYFATSVNIPGDINQDGNIDILVGSVGMDTNGLNAGSAHLVYLGANQQILSSIEFSESLSDCDNFNVNPSDGFGVDMDSYYFPDKPSTPVFLIGSQLADFSVTDGGKLGFYQFEVPFISPAGENQILCDTFTTSLNASENSNYKWALLSGSGMIQDPINPKTEVKNLTDGITLIKWYDQTCPSKSDTVAIILAPPNQPVLPKDTILCNTKDITLKYIKGNFINSWTTLNGSATVENVKDSTVYINNLNLGLNTFLLTNSNLNCLAKSDTINILNYIVDKGDIPNVVTANNDGKNDTFKLPEYLHNFNTSIVIVNRWGKDVYRSPKYDDSWYPPTNSIHYYYMNIKECNVSLKGNISTLK